MEAIAKADPSRSTRPEGNCRSTPPLSLSSTGRSLRRTDVFVRIRPLAESGGHANEDGNDAVKGGDRGSGPAKALEGWTNSTVTLSTQYLFSKGSAVYDFPRRVLGPEATQVDTYEEMGLPGLADEFVAFGGRNVVFFAYGQTGSGKTHTMLGTDASLDTSSIPDVREEGWGIFPRVFRAALERARDAGRPFVLSASAIEFYLGACSDLLSPCDGGNGTNAVRIDPDTHLPIGVTVREMEGLDDLLELLASVRRNRATRGTRMNDGSSRSHAAIILYLSQINPEEGTYCRTSFTMVDLGGAERPSRTGETRFTSAEMVLWEKESQGKEVPTGAQAYIINYELSGIATEVRKATDAFDRGKKYAPPKQLLTEAVRFLGACFDGMAMTSMCLCLSPANVNGWETWFSLQYGTNVSKLRVPVRRQKPVNIDRAYRSAKKSAQEAAEELRAAPKNKYYSSRESRAVAAERRVNELEMMMAKMQSVRI